MIFSTVLDIYAFTAGGGNGSGSGTGLGSRRHRPRYRRHGSLNWAHDSVLSVALSLITAASTPTLRAA
jgi:hypothetical protein